MKKASVFDFITKEAIMQLPKIRQSLKKGNAAPLYFPDIQAIFKRVWHKGLLYKIQAILLLLMESYLTSRFFQVREDGELSIIQDIMAEVPQGSVLFPVLYTIYTADFSETQVVTTATFADGTAILASRKDPIAASAVSQNNLNEFYGWIQNWRIKTSTTKSGHNTFILRRRN